MSSRPQKTLEAHNSEANDDDKNEELEKLETAVNEMAQKILDYRASLPDQLKNTLASILASQRPTVMANADFGCEPGPSCDPNPDASGPSESGNIASLAEEDQETAEKTKLLRQKISSNVSAMPIVLKRMKDCLSRIDNLDLENGIIHPVFKRKRTS